MEAKEVIVNNLTGGTLAAARKYFLRIGENAETLTDERVTKLLQRHFEGLLDYHFNDSFTRGDADFEKEKQAYFSKHITQNVREREELGGELLDVFATGYYNGYVAGCRDMEEFKNVIDETTKDV